MKRFCLILFALFGCLSLYAQTPEQTLALARLDNAKDDTSKLNAYIDLHNAYFKSDPPKSGYYAQQLLSLGLALGDAKYISRGYRALARCERKKRNYTNIFHLDSLALQYAQQYGDQNLVYSQQIMLIHDYMDAEMMKEAFRWFAPAEATLTKITDVAAHAEMNKTIGYYYRETNQHKKAIPYFQKAIAGFAEANNDYNVAESKVFLAQSLHELGSDDSTANLLFDALAIYAKRNSQSAMGLVNELLGDVLLANGNADKGIEHYLEAKHLYNISNNDVDEGLCLIYLARAYLFKKDITNAQQYITTAQDLFAKMDYNIGKIKVQTLWGQFYSETGEPATADFYFTTAANLLKKEDLPDLVTENEKYWSQHKYRVKQFNAADSLVYSYSSREAASKEPEVLAKQLGMISGKNKQLDSNSLRLLSLLYMPNGAKLLQKELKGRPLSDVLPMDSLMRLSPFSYATAAYDSSVNMAYTQQLLDLEAKYQLKQKDDSLRIANGDILLAKTELDYKNTLLLAAAAVGLLLAAGVWLQYRYRKTAERDKARIELLQGEINHRIKNNLAIVKRFAEIADKADKKNLPLASLQSRIDAIELLHKNLYQSGKMGNIVLQQYLHDLAAAIESTFAGDDKDIKILVHAPVITNMQTAEKIGLIVNELMTNSFKYAFTGKDAGNINIRAVEVNKQQFRLQYTDDGAGFNNDQTVKGYGSKLIRGLAQELNAAFEYHSGKGVEFTMVL